MLKIICPHCHFTSTIAQPKAGKFTSTCHRCKNRFQLVVKLQPDGKFASKASVVPALDLKPRPADSTNEKSEATAQKSNLSPNRPFDSEDNRGAAPIDTDQGFVIGQRGAGSEKPPANLPTLNLETVDAKSKLSIGSNLGPYRLVKLLGQGGMGEVYLAKQTSLDRDVALKVINIQLSDSPKALARFTREAYAAAKLVHPNIVQVYDMGDDRGYCYFSMEYVSGTTLAEFVANERKLEPLQAARFILQAARGLAHAHAAGMVHRDVKPGNLLVDASGVVKVADLGLVKVPDQDEIGEAFDVENVSALSASQDLTRIGSAIGTPYYMAPEQARNAVKVDHRADIYSLGCTFYALLSGKKPFDGQTFQQIIKQHHASPATELSRLVVRVPAFLSGVVSKMMQKDPNQRYQSLNELIPELEQFLGILAPANFIPEEQDVKTLQRNAAEFNAVKLVAIRGWVPVAMVASCVLLSFMVSFLSWRWASGFVVMPMFALLAYFFVSGAQENSPLFSKARELVFEGGIFSWLKWLMAALILVVASFLSGLYFPWLFAAVVGTILAIAYYGLIDRAIIAERQGPLEETRQLLRKMRLHGLDESTVQKFVATSSGQHWEEFFENLFDYETQRRMRDELAKSRNASYGSKFWAGRDKFYDRWSLRLKSLQAAKERKLLERVEFAGLRAEGHSAADAQERAAQWAAVVVDQATEQKIAALEKRLAELDPKFDQEKKRDRIKQMLADARSGKYRQNKTRVQQMEPTLNRYAGSYTRFLLGCFLIAGSLLWAKQNGILAAFRDGEPIQRQADNSKQDAGPDNAAPVAKDAAESADAGITELMVLEETLNKETTPLNIPVFGRLFFRDLNSMIAGLILVASALVLGWKMTLFAIPAACIAIFGSHIIRFDLETFPSLHSISALIAIGVFLLGVVFGRAED